MNTFNFVIANPILYGMYPCYCTAILKFQWNALTHYSYSVAKVQGSVEMFTKGKDYDLPQPNPNQYHGNTKWQQAERGFRAAWGHKKAQVDNGHWSTSMNQRNSSDSAHIFMFDYSEEWVIIQSITRKRKEKNAALMWCNQLSFFHCINFSYWESFTKCQLIISACSPSEATVILPLGKPCKSSTCHKVWE